MNFKYSFLLLLFLPFSVQAKTVFLEVRDFNFSPNFIEIDQGDTVIWTNRGNVPHTVGGDGFESGTLGTQETFEFTFDTPGTLDYSDALYPSMTGRISVLEVEVSTESLIEESLEDDSEVEETLESSESLSDFFEANAPSDPTPPSQSSAPLASPAQEEQRQSQVAQQAMMDDDAALTTSGGSWLYALGLGIFGAILFLSFRRG